MGARYQGDLFDKSHMADKRKKEKISFSLPRIKKNISLSYENIIFLMIGFIMSCIIFYSLGVEKGRRLVVHQKTVHQTPETKHLTSSTSRYIIQIAAFKKKVSAEEEMARLKEEGYNAEIRKSGDYYQIYIGGFDKKQKAQQLLTELKQKYKDCYIREL